MIGTHTIRAAVLGCAVAVVGLSARTNAAPELLSLHPDGSAGTAPSGSDTMLAQAASPAAVRSDGAVCFASLSVFDDLWDEPGTIDVYCAGGALMALRSTYNQIINPVGRGDCDFVAFSSDLTVGAAVRQDAFDPLHLHRPGAGRGLYLLDGMPDERLTPVGANVARPAVSPDGLWCVFTTDAPLAGSADRNQACDVYAVRLSAGEPWTPERVSLTAAGDEPQGDDLALYPPEVAGNRAYEVYGVPRISNAAPFGRQVVFVSNAVNLPGATEAMRGPYVYLRRGVGGNATTERLSVRRAPGHDGESPGPCTEPDISADGRCVVFVTADPRIASASVPLDGQTHIVVFGSDGELPETQNPMAAYADVNDSGVLANGDSSAPRLSADGRFVVFISTATNLGAAVSGGIAQVYVRDRLRGTTECVSLSAEGDAADRPCISPALSADGRYVVFASAALNLAPNPAGVHQVYRVDRGEDALLGPPTLSGRRRLFLAVDEGGGLVASLTWGPDGALNPRAAGDSRQSVRVRLDTTPAEGTLTDVHGGAVAQGTLLSETDFPLTYAASAADGNVLEPLVFRAVDSFGVTSDAWQLHILYNANVYDLDAGWNLISFPFDAGSAGRRREDTGLPLSFDGMSLWSWDSERARYVRAEEVAAGLGYWVYAAVPRTLAFRGRPAAASGLREVDGAWRLAGPVGNGRFARPVVGASSGPVFWQWSDGALRPVQQTDDGLDLVAGVGYWCVSVSGSISVDLELNEE